MKKISLFFIITSLFFINLSSISADSGACSWHNGVNCGIGPDWDGSVICNDGWKDSSIDFYSTIECFENVRCTTSELNSLRNKYNLSEKQKKLEDQATQLLEIQQEISQSDFNRQKEIDNAYDRVVSMSTIISAANEINRRYDSERTYMVIELNREMRLRQTYQNDLDSTLSQINRDCQELGFYELIDWSKEIQKIRLEQHVALSCPLHSSYLNEKCVCVDGYIMKNSRCITHTENCIISFGQNISGVKEDNNNNSSCSCDDNYEWNTSKTGCVKSVVCPSNFSKVNNTCVCDDNYEWNTFGNLCIEKKEEKALSRKEDLNADIGSVEIEEEPEGALSLNDNSENDVAINDNQNIQKEEIKKQANLASLASAFVGGFFTSIGNFFGKLFSIF